MIIVVMGVSGSGKTTIGKMLADAIRCSFLEGDSLHSKDNIEKMSHGIPLTDSDRAPWLTAIHARLLEFFKRGESLVVACSALEQQYREVLADGVPITWVYLKGSTELIRGRMKQRRKHFMKADMLPSQFHALEEPSDAIVVDISELPSAIVAQILTQLPRPRPTFRGRAAPQHDQKIRVRG
jgi:gluconokinase